MVSEKIKHNAEDIRNELGWFREILSVRSKLNAGESCKYSDLYQISPPELKESRSAFSTFVYSHRLGFSERFLLILAAIPHIKPELLDMFLAQNKKTQQSYTEFGGKKAKHHSGFLPTGETVLFILAGEDLDKRFSVQQLFDSSHPFSRERILWLDEVDKGEPRLSGSLSISEEVLDLFTAGEQKRPVFSAEFPAKLLTTKMEWEDLVLPDSILRQLNEIETWILNRDKMMHDWGMDKFLKPGYKALFHGPPGTGKTITASLLAKKTGRDLYRIDLSQTVSKYIGETEKNLAGVFDRAENREWILFFDEADALFGNRTKTQDAHDRYANQQVSYLLQRIEDYNGLVILASNFSNNIDSAFMRRLQTMIQFPVPGVDERYKLWKNGFGSHVCLEDKVDLKKLAKEYEVAGGIIVNVIQHSMLRTLNRQSTSILHGDIMDGMKREFQKQRRTI
ncbi:MAG: ATP-binding protein [Balneolales bacterium]